MLSEPTPLNTLNIGKNLIQTSADKYQRAIMIIGIIENHSSVIDDEALYNALKTASKQAQAGKIKFDLHILEYSKLQNNILIQIMRFIN